MTHSEVTINKFIDEELKILPKENTNESNDIEYDSDLSINENEETLIDMLKWVDANLININRSLVECLRMLKKYKTKYEDEIQQVFSKITTNQKCVSDFLNV